VDVLVNDDDEIVVEYIGLIAGPNVQVGVDTEKEDFDKVGVRVAVLHEGDADAFLVVWQYIEGNLQDRWKLMWRNDKLPDALKFWGEFVGDLYHDYGRGEYAERDKRLQRAE